jgi:tRNA G18 (ribose-2'-O)-methylase SpoU
VPLRPGGPDSLNVAMAATVALYELNRMAGHA